MRRTGREQGPAFSPDRSFVGGVGSIWGALMIAVLGNGLIRVSDVWQYIVKGAVIIGAVALDRYRLTSTARN